MKSRIFKSENRGHASHGWLNSYHSFSFASFHDESLMHFGLLRVLNDDTVDAAMGFGSHPHDNMEIVSIPLEGDLHHRDSTGRSEIIRQGEVQIMSAGSGIVHSEMNASQTEPVKFLQIWVFPEKRNITPHYEQRPFPVEKRIDNFQTVVSPDNADALKINQQAWFTLINPTEGRIHTYNLNKEGNGIYLFIIEGDAEIDGQLLNRRDAIGIWEAEAVSVKAHSSSQWLIIEVPMN